jgi:uncharacterized protein (DUF1501 family)
MMNINRRKFLTQLGAAAGLGALSDLERIAAAATLGSSQSKLLGEDYRALVCIFMFGGNDANNMVIPTSTTEYQQYASGRTSVLALAQGSLLPVNIQNTPGRTFGLHPSMTGMQGLINSGKAAILANIGPLYAPITRTQLQNRSVRTPPDLYSHSDQQAQWQSATSYEPPRNGWGGRLGDLVAAANGTNRSSTLISVTGNNLFEVGTTMSSFKVSSNTQFGFDFYKGGSATDPLSKGVNELLGLHPANMLENAWEDIIARAIQNQQTLAAALAAVPAFTTVFPNTGLGGQMQTIARLVAARQALGLKRQVFFASIGGFDTHGEDQIDTQQRLLGEVSGAMTALYNATVELNVAENVTAFTSSDFNRTFPSNGKGSDHAWGSHHLVAGGSVNGGMMYGTFPTLVRGGPDDTGSGGLWIPTTSVDQMGATLATWMGSSAADVNTIFPNVYRFPTPNLGFMK